MEYHVTIKDLPEELRPRERLLRYGEQVLSVPELIAILLGSGTREMTAIQLAEHLLHKKSLPSWEANP
jgi:DNA repair protein RadC